ncbi:subtilisin-like protein, partial [Conidiobolus coronatus NRRL 28638]
IISVQGEIIPNKYIIKFNDDRSNTINSPLTAVNRILSMRSSRENKVLHQYKHAINGMSVKADFSAINGIKMLANIHSIEPVYRVYADAIQKNSTWGIARVSQREKLNNSSFEYLHDENAGSGVNIYIVDTGINIKHADFEGRAKWGTTTAEYSSDDDENGHGTHCAGIAASKTYGVAKKANLIAVKVLGDDGFGSSDDIIAGIDWVIGHNSGSNSKVISMSLGSRSPGDYLNEVTENAVKNGIVTVVAAGNSNADACRYTPAGAPNAITVASSNIKDEKSYFSNYGKCIDIIAPGEDILSTFRGSDTATETYSGTSMACPHVAGIAATLLSK